MATPLGDYNSNGVRSFKLTAPDGSYGGVHVSYDPNYDKNSYKATTQHNATVKSAATGAKSVNTVPATVTQTVPKREVMSKVFRNGRAIGARVLTKGIPIVGQLALAWELADTVAKQKGDH